MFRKAGAIVMQGNRKQRETDELELLIFVTVSELVITTIFLLPAEFNLLELAYTSFQTDGE